MKNTGQTVTLGLAVGLILASLWRGQQFQGIWNALSSNVPDPNVKQTLLNIGGDALFLIIIVWLAGLSDDASKMTGALLVGMWLLFLFHGAGSTTSTTTKNFQVGNPKTWIAV